MRKIEIINPTIGTESADEARETTPPAVSDRLAGEEELKIAYLSNGKPNTRELFSLIDGELEYGHKTDSRFFEKDSAAHAAPDSMVADIKRYADLAVVGTAD